MLIGDYWFDFHSGYRVTKDAQHPEIKWVPVKMGYNDTKCMNVLFLDQHAAVVTPKERNDCIQYVQQDDNPFYVPPSP